MTEASLQLLHQDMDEVKKEIRELKILLITEPELRASVVKKVAAARHRMKSEYVTQAEMKREFLDEWPLKYTGIRRRGSFSERWTNQPPPRS